MRKAFDVIRKVPMFLADYFSPDSFRAPALFSDTVVFTYLIYFPFFMI